MVGSQPTQESGSTLPTKKILQMLEELKGRIEGLTNQVTATQQSVTDLTEQAKKNITLWEASHENLAVLSEEYSYLSGKFTENKGLVEGSLQRI
ncbi:hypothetical protein ACLB2K_074326 [Fragaria x ananassa]